MEVTINLDEEALRKIRNAFSDYPNPIRALQVGIKLDFFVFGIEHSDEMRFKMREIPLMVKMLDFERIKESITIQF